MWFKCYRPAACKLLKKEHVFKSFPYFVKLFLIFRKSSLWIGGICQFVNCLLLKHGGLSSILSSHGKQSTTPVFGRQRQENLWGLLANQYSQVRSSRLSERPCHKITKADSNWEGHPSLTSGLDTYPEAHTYAHTQENPAFICHLSTFQSSPEKPSLLHSGNLSQTDRKKEKERTKAKKPYILFSDVLKTTKLWRQKTN